jgi:hypothetical protein
MPAIYDPRGRGSKWRDPATGRWTRAPPPEEEEVEEVVPEKPPEVPPPEEEEEERPFYRTTIALRFPVHSEYFSAIIYGWRYDDPPDSGQLLDILLGVIEDYIGYDTEELALHGWWRGVEIKEYGEAEQIDYDYEKDGTWEADIEEQGISVYSESGKL